MRKTIKFLPLLAASAVVVGCQDFDFGVTGETFKKKEYAENFEKTFGKIDPEQDWSMATLVSANVNLPEITGTSKMNIMTGDPRDPETRLLAQIMLQNGQGHIDFDAIKGHNHVFVTVEKDGKYEVFSQYAIVDGMLNIGKVFATRGGVGNVNPVNDFSSTCPTTLNKDSKGLVTVSDISVVTDEIDGYLVGSYYKSPSEWATWIKAGNVNGSSNNSPYTDESLLKYIKKSLDFSHAQFKDADHVEIVGDNITYYPQGKSVNPNYNYTNTVAGFQSWYNVTNYLTTDGPYVNNTIELVNTPCAKGDSGAEFVGIEQDESKWVLKSDVKPTYKLFHPQWQYLKNVEQVPAPAWNRGLGYTLFGPGGFFEEKEAYYGEKKRALYQTDDLAKIEEGFVIESTGGPITLPYIFGCTQFANQFGYIYWQDGQDPLEQPHYVLMEDARPSSNIYYGTWNESTNAVGDMALSGWDTGIGGLDAYNAAYQYRETNPEMWEKVAGQQIVGTSYRVMYFDADGNGTYNFPAGYKIAFFIDKLSTADNLTTHDGHQSGNYNYSLPELNKRIYNYNDDEKPYLINNQHNYGYSESPTYSDHHNETNGMVDGMVKAISWQQDGNYYLGFGDNSGDHDLNDIVFMVQGSFTTSNGIKLSSVKWHRNTDGSHHTNDDDIFEQSTPKIGATYSAPTSEPKRDGYTFQGWSTTPDNSSNDCSKTVSGTATAEGICYYAIWNDTPLGTTVTVKWHKNVDGKHHDGTNSTTADDDLQVDPQNVTKGSHPTKPATDPTAPTGKQFLGWAETPEATTPLTDSELSAITINADKCFYAVYGPINVDPQDDPAAIKWIFACEDLGGSFDYDFNDVVWEVAHVAGGTKVAVRLLAAGGTLPFTLNFNGQKVYTKQEAFGSSTEVFIQPTPTAWKQFDVADTWTLWSGRQEFTVAVEGNDGTSYISAYSKNDAENAVNTKTPEVIILPDYWCWPLEGVKISTAYTGFPSWVSDNNYVTWPAPAAGTTVSR